MHVTSQSGLVCLEAWRNGNSLESAGFNEFVLSLFMVYVVVG